MILFNYIYQEMNIAFIINSTRKLSKFAKEVLALVEASTVLNGKLYYTTYAKHAESIAKEIIGTFDVLVAIGGDGTFNEVINGLNAVNNKAVKFAIIPNGTGNDFSKMISIKSPNDFLTKIMNDSFQKIDLGMVDLKEKKKLFINIADIGFGAKVVEVLNRQRAKGFGGKMSYAIAILKTFILHKKAHIEIQSKEFTYKGKFLMVAFCNGSTFGHGLVIHPNAKINDGKLGVTIIGDVSLISYLLNLKSLKKGRPIKHDKVHYFETEKANLKIDGFKQWIEGDGELFGSDVNTISIMPNAIKLLV